MILIDVNLLLYSKFEDFPENERARRWLEDTLSSSSNVGMPWHSLLGFIRIATNARMFERPLTTRAAWQQVTEWLTYPKVWIPGPTDDHRQILGRLLLETRATGNLVPDASLAAIAIGHRLTLCSTDRDFARFRGLDWTNPLEATDTELTP